MNGYQLKQFENIDVSVAFTAEIDDLLARHFEKCDEQEDLTFAYWHPSRGAHRYTAILYGVALPSDSERILQGNVAFTSEYLSRVLDGCPDGSGIAFMHSHLGRGWQDMSQDDIEAERNRIASVVASKTGLPLVGLTWATDRMWSARLWLRAGRNDYRRKQVSTVRSVGRRLRLSYHPEILPAPLPRESQVATCSVWGKSVQSDLVRMHIGIVGLGSVGSVVAESLSRMGIQHITLIDHDFVEERNLDRTLGANAMDARNKTLKVAVSKRLIDQSHTANKFCVTYVAESVLSPNGMHAALDCDVIICCVDRPYPRHIMNVLSYSHLIPVIDGGILAIVKESDKLQYLGWRIHTIGAGYPCMYCLDALRRSDVDLDFNGQLDNPEYIQGLEANERESYQRRNVFSFSLSVAAHQCIQLVGLVSGNKRICGTGAQTYNAFPGTMTIGDKIGCSPDCDISPLTAKAIDLESEK